MNLSNNKSRPERLVFVNHDYKKAIEKRRKPIGKSVNKSSSSKKSKLRKRKLPKPKQKFVPGEFIFDTKGQMAEIKYIGECHKGRGTWYGIEFVDGSLGKHNGTIQGKTYFFGADRRCDMIRADKIRNKVSPNISLSAKRIVPKPNKSNKAKRRQPRHKRTSTDTSCLESISLSELSRTVSDNHLHKKRPKHNKHRMATPPSRINTERDELLFGTKSREEKVIYRGSAYRKYKPKTQAVKTVKKEKYKGNKYILAMEQETEKRKHERIGYIKMDKKRVKQEKHKRTSSKMQEILKRKEMRKKQISKLNQENRLRELQRIQAAKQKSKRRMNRQRSQSDYTDIRKHEYDRYKARGPSDTGSDNNKVKTKCKLSMISLSKDQTLRISRTPLSDSNIATVSAEFPDTTDVMKQDMTNYAFDDEDSLHEFDAGSDVMDEDDVDSLFCSSSEERTFAADEKLPVNVDSALLLEEMLHQPMPELISPDPCAFSSPSALPLHIRSITASTTKRLKKTLEHALDEQEEFEPFPIKQNKPPRCFPLKRTDTVPIMQSEDRGTEYWIQKYNKMNEKLLDTQNEIRRTMRSVAPDDESQNKSDTLPDQKSITASKSVNFLNVKLSKKEEEFEFYGTMSNRKAIKRSVSLTDTSPTKLTRGDSAPLVTNDDKGTDYWIQQYNKANKKKSASKRKSKSKQNTSVKKKVKTLRPLPKNEKSKSVLSIINPDRCESLDVKYTEISPQNAFITDDMSDIASSVLSDPSLSILSFDSTTNGSVISSLNTSPSTSPQSTPVNKTPNNEVAPTYFNDAKEMNATLAQEAKEIKYGGYPFQRKREQYINKKFTGIVRLGHRYLLRDGRVGVVRFINATRFARGTWIGIELDSDEGEHNGCVHGVKYFECGPMCGTFVKKSQIAQYINRDTTKSLLRNQLKYLNAAAAK